MELSPAERPAAIQIFGDQPEIMAKAAEKAMEFEPQAIDKIGRASCRERV